MEIEIYQLLHDNWLLLLFLVIGLGYLVGNIRIAGTPVGPTIGVLLAGLLVLTPPLAADSEDCVPCHTGPDAEATAVDPPGHLLQEGIARGADFEGLHRLEHLAAREAPLASWPIIAGHGSTLARDRETLSRDSLPARLPAQKREGVPSVPCTRLVTVVNAGYTLG